MWWIHTTHDEHSHALAAEAVGLLDQLPAARTLIYYTTPAEPLGPHVGRQAQAASPAT